MYLKLTVKSSRNLFCIISRSYHSDGVYGFRPKPKKKYIVSENVLKKQIEHSNFYRLVSAYRRDGHHIASINPVSFIKGESTLSVLEPSHYGLENGQSVNFEGIINHPKSSGTIAEAVDFLKRVYSTHLTMETMHLENQEEVDWLTKTIEKETFDKIDNSTKKTITKDLLQSQALDNFLTSKFPGTKRYGGEGSESQTGLYRELFKLCTNSGVENLIISLCHRGRLDIVTGLMDFPLHVLFYLIQGNPFIPTKYNCSDDVFMHTIVSRNVYVNDKRLHLSVVPNPSHLEVSNAVALGKTRGKYMSEREGEYVEDREFGSRFINIQVHGDAAFVGQGINQELFAIHNLPHFNVGGTIHFIINNQVGFTTPSDRGRATKYPTDIAKGFGFPILHVNGDYPEEAVRAIRVAFAYQQKFHKSVLIDINCFRRWGHNELDDPSFTNPHLYKVIHNRKSVPDIYAERMVQEGVMTKDEVNNIVQKRHEFLNEELKKSANYETVDPGFKEQWSGYEMASETITNWNTGVHRDVLIKVGQKSVEIPKEFNLHPTLEKHHVTNRLKKISDGTKIDWATAEAMAVGSLLYEGYNARISGQDVGRGTFSQRHFMLIDQNTNLMHIPLNHIDPQQAGFLEVANSILSEEGILGFEYGMSLENPNNLIMWEAQFGDFFNGAQALVDTYVASGETKWLRCSGIVMLLPHGLEGGGADHSSSRIERFLQLSDSHEDKPDSDNVNIYVCQPSTPANYFHLLRRQMVRNFRKPLILITPKTLLRLSAAVSSLSEMEPGTTFIPVIGDNTVNPSEVKRVILTAGRHYYTLFDKRASLGLKDTALVRVESFCPFPLTELYAEVAKYANAKVYIWAQEEHRNSGAWQFIKPRFENLVGKRIKYCGRPMHATVCTSLKSKFSQEGHDIANEAFSIV